MELLNCDRCGDSIHLDDVTILGTYWMPQYYCKRCYGDIVTWEYLIIVKEQMNEV